MKQIIQNLRTGETVLDEIPVPVVRDGHLLIRTSRSLVSTGTERMLVEFGRANLLEKAFLQPERIKMLTDKIRSDGFLPTLKAAVNKLDQAIPLGYCNAGQVIEVGAGVYGIQAGDRVISNGCHAEVVCVPRNLTARIPDDVDDEAAVFTITGAIALNGIRLLGPAIGETVVVIGLGLIGLLTAQLLMINGCVVIGVDRDQDKLRIADTLGIMTVNAQSGNQVGFVQQITSGIGADGVIIAASSKDSDIFSSAAKMSRKRGKIILVGDAPMNLNRSDFYEKELSFQVACSYGPGRYDPSYESSGHDYPVGHVRWTGNRNFQAILQLLSKKSLHVKPLITAIIPLSDFKEIYAGITRSAAIATIIKYPESVDSATVVKHNDANFHSCKGVIGIIGAGNFTKMTLMPLLKDCSLKFIASAGGLSGNMLAKKYRIAFSTTDYREILKDEEVDLVFITTRHHLHAKLAVECMQAGKHVFVEKPLAILPDELFEMESAFLKLKTPNVSLTVGFNRRFAPLILKMKNLLDVNLKMNIIITINAGLLPAESWIRDPTIGGGRIIGEACHFMDLAAYLAGSRIISVCSLAMAGDFQGDTDNTNILIKFGNGSTGALQYFSNGHKAYAKERIEVHSGGKSLILDNFRRLKGYGFKGFFEINTSQDKGHRQLFSTLLERVKSGGVPVIPFEEIMNSTRATLAAVESVKSGNWVHL